LAEKIALGLIRPRREEMERDDFWAEVWGGNGPTCVKEIVKHFANSFEKRVSNSSNLSTFEDYFAHR
jgi:hypothetical protein